MACERNKSRSTQHQHSGFSAPEDRSNEAPLPPQKKAKNIFGEAGFRSHNCPGAITPHLCLPP